MAEHILNWGGGFSSEHGGTYFELRGALKRAPEAPTCRGSVGILSKKILKAPPAPPPPPPVPPSLMHYEHNKLYSARASAKKTNLWVPLYTTQTTFTLEE